LSIDVEQLVAYAHKNGLEDPFFRRKVKCIIDTYQTIPYKL